MRGRKPAATTLRVFDGGKSDSKPNRASRSIQSKTVPKAPREPNWLEALGDTDAAGLAAAEWARVVPGLLRLGVISEHDGRLLQDYCICCAQLDWANRQIAAGMTTVTDDHGTKKHPALTMANQVRQQLKFYISELGLSPTARLRMDLGGTSGKPGLDLD